MSEPKSTSIRIPFDLCEWLEKQAATEHRSLNGQIIYLLDRAKAQEEIKAE